MTKLITTDRLRMRPFARGDEDRLAALHGDADLMAFMRGGAQNRNQVAAELERYVECWSNQNFGMWALFEGEAFIGECGLRMRDDGLGVRLRFIIDKPYWGRGFAAEAVNAALGYGFEVAIIDRIKAVAQERNPASHRVLEKAGLTVENVTKNDRGHDIRVYSIMIEQWKFIRLAAP